MKLLWIVLLCSFSLWAGPAETLRKVEQASRSLTRLREMNKAWAAVAEYERKQGLSFPMWYEYRDMPKSKRVELIKKNFRVRQLAELLETDRWLAQATKDQVIISQEARRLRKEHAEFRQLLLAYHQSDLTIDDEFFDEVFGIDYHQTEGQIQVGKYEREVVTTFPKTVSQSDYRSIREVFRLRVPQRSDVVYDLGSGYGRFLFYGAILYPAAQFKGVEYVKERAAVVTRIAEQFQLKNLKQISADVLSVDFSDGTYFYLYNPFFELMPQVLARFKTLATSKSYTIIGREVTTLELNRETWLVRRSKNSFYAPVVFETAKP